MDDIELLSGILADVKAEDPVIQDLYVQFLQYGLDRAADPNDSTALKQMITQAITRTSPSQGVMRTFPSCSICEFSRSATPQPHDSGNTITPMPARIRKKQWSLPLTEDSCAVPWKISGAATPDEIYNQLTLQRWKCAHGSSDGAAQIVAAQVPASVGTLGLLERTDINALKVRRSET
jgi:hypothetical protein